MKIHFYKYQGTGNDFVMIDNRDGFFPKGNRELIALLCHRRYGIGADGLILLENAQGYDFQMVYYNSDGNESSMCGNGGRCIVSFAKHLKIITEKAFFIAVDGEHFAQFDEKEQVQLQMKDVEKVTVAQNYVFLNTGSPHHVQFVENIKDFDVQTEGAKIRYGELYADKGGSNVNFVSQLESDTFYVRTYERGVEAETYSCGTGVTAVAVAMHHIGKTTTKKIDLHTPGGKLNVFFEIEEDSYKNIYLCGPATFVFEGDISVDSLTKR